MSIVLATALAASAQPDIILSREDAEGMAAQDLAAAVLAEFPHGRIVQVKLPDIETIVHGTAPDPSLSYITFIEEGQAAAGRFCKARTIVATFDWLVGKKPKAYAERVRSDSKRLFAVNSRPTIAVLDGDATDADCSALPADRYAALSSSADHEMRLGQFLTLTERFGDGLAVGVPVQCGDWRGAEEKSCDAKRALESIDWSRLSSVQQIEWPHGNPATKITFTQAEGPLIHAYLSGESKIEAAKLTYAWPAPF